MKIDHLCYSFFVDQIPPPPIIEDEIRWNLLQQKALNLRATQAFTLLRDNGIEPILIKGPAAAIYYPESKIRLSADIDLAVANHSFDAASAICASAAAIGLAIDLHRELRHLDTVNWESLFEKSRLVDIDGAASIRVLCPEDHLRVLIVHWLTDGGSDRERLWDIYYAIENRPPDFDWGRFLDLVGENRRRWLVCTIGLAHHFLGLDVDDTPIANQVRDVPRWLIKTVEQEWASAVPKRPMEVTLKSPRMFFQQARKRLRPNPIWATVQMEGSFDARTRFFYRVGNFFTRIVPSYRRIARTLKLESK